MEKLKILAYSDPKMIDTSLKGTFIALVNPESYSIESKVEYKKGQGHGTSSAQQRFTLKEPEEMAFDFFLDNTGIIDGNPRNDITDDILRLRDLLVEFHGDKHEPYHIKLVWGDYLFKGRCSSLNITYKLFNPDGTPIRAVCKVTIKESIEEKERVAGDDQQSADITHYYKVRKGDTLPLLCFKIYEDPSYYIEVAKANKLINFQNLEEGTEIFFPPFE